MSYDSLETSVEDGRPIHLYRFTLGETVWRYTSADEDLTIGGVVWRAVPIADDGIRQTGQAVSDAFTITASSNIGPAQVYMAVPPSETILVERLGTHEGLTVPVVAYMGEVVQVNFPTPGQAVISAQTLGATMRRDGLRIGYQRTCPFVLYDPSTCRVNKAAFAVSAVIAAVDGFNVLATAFASVSPAHSLRGGFLEWAHPTLGTQRAFIESHAPFSTTVRIFGDTSAMYPGLAVTAYPGCERTMDACNSFSNLANYGGFPWMPGKSPFNGMGTPFY